MRTKMLLVLLGAGVVFSGCTSYVRTFDADDKQVGACVSYKGLFGPRLHCNGSANPKEQLSTK